MVHHNHPVWIGQTLWDNSVYQSQLASQSGSREREALLEWALKAGCCRSCSSKWFVVITVELRIQIARRNGGEVRTQKAGMCENTYFYGGF